MDAAEQMTGPDDTPGAAAAYGVERAAPRPVDAGEPEDMHRQAVVGMQCQPVGLGFDAATVAPLGPAQFRLLVRSEEHTSELQSLMRTSYAVFRLTKKQKQ